MPDFTFFVAFEHGADVDGVWVGQVVKAVDGLAGADLPQFGEAGVAGKKKAMWKKKRFFRNLKSLSYMWA